MVRRNPVDEGVGHSWSPVWAAVPGQDKRPLGRAVGTIELPHGLIVQVAAPDLGREVLPRPRVLAVATHVVDGHHGRGDREYPAVVEPVEQA